MNLTSDLETLQLPEIFWLCIHFEKNAIINCTSNTNKTSFYFYNGNLERISNPYPELLIGNLLQRQGFINEKELNRSLKQQRELNKPIGQVLIQLNLITREHLAKMLEFQIREIVLRIAAEGDSHCTMTNYPEDEIASIALKKHDMEQLINLAKTILQELNEYLQLREEMPGNDVIPQISDALRDKIDLLNKEEIKQIISDVEAGKTLGQIRFEGAPGILKIEKYLKPLFKNGYLINPMQE